LGLGKNVQSFGYLPEAPNDSIFAIMGESFGFLGLVGILVFLGALLLRLLNILDRTSDMRLRLLVAGVFGWLATHSLLNIGAMVGLIPLTGITLPLLSFGGSSLLFIMLALGIVFGISRYSVHGKIIGDETDKNQGADSGRRLRRPRRAGSGGH
jgi:cell division protein FtsW